jgi:hypothetical protein
MLPARDHHREREALLAARSRASAVVDGLWRDHGEMGTVLERLNKDASLDGPLRRVARNEVLRRSAAKPPR